MEINPDSCLDENILSQTVDKTNFITLSMLLSNLPIGEMLKNS